MSAFVGGANTQHCQTRQIETASFVGVDDSWRSALTRFCSIQLCSPDVLSVYLMSATLNDYSRGQGCRMCCLLSSFVLPRIAWILPMSAMVKANADELAAWSGSEERSYRLKNRRRPRAGPVASYLWTNLPRKIIRRRKNELATTTKATVRPELPLWLDRWPVWPWTRDGAVITALQCYLSPQHLKSNARGKGAVKEEFTSWKKTNRTGCR